MKSMFLVRSEHLNHQGHLFGGDLMAESDTIGYCLLRQEYGHKAFVTRAAEISFDHPARLGDVIEFEAHLLKVGNTSVQVEVTGTVGKVQISSARLVYVSVGAKGEKTPVGA